MLLSMVSYVITRLSEKLAGANGGFEGFNHVTVSHHLCETGKYRVCKARVGIAADNLGFLIKVFVTFLMD
jgi:hypothetical protein